MRPLEQTIIGIANHIHHNELDRDTLIEKIEKYCRIMERQEQELHLKKRYGK